MATQPPPPPAGPPADYFMTPPPPPGAVPYAVPPEQAGYQPAWNQPAYGAMGAGVGLGLMSQFTGAALSSCVVGLISIIVPFAFGYVFYILPIAGILAGARAIMRGKVIGGAAGIGLNVIGGLITVIALKA